MASVMRRKGDPARVKTALTSAAWAGVRGLDVGRQIELESVVPVREPKVTVVSRTCPELMGRVSSTASCLPWKLPTNRATAGPGAAAWPVTSALTLSLAGSSILGATGAEFQAAFGGRLQGHGTAAAGGIKGGHLEVEPVSLGKEGGQPRLQVKVLGDQERTLGVGKTAAPVQDHGIDPVGGHSVGQGKGDLGLSLAVGAQGRVEIGQGSKRLRICP